MLISNTEALNHARNVSKGASNRGGESGGPPPRKKNQSFKFECFKWPILAEITAKSAIYSHFLCQQGGVYIPPCGPERGVRTPPPGGNPCL